MTLWAEFPVGLLARLEVSDAHPYACAGSCPWLAAGPRCRLWPQRLRPTSPGLPRRALDCVGAGFAQFAPLAWKEAI